MSKEILMVVDAVSNEKGVEKDVIFEAIEAALRLRHAGGMARISMFESRSTGKLASTIPSDAGWCLKTSPPNLNFRIANCA